MHFCSFLLVAQHLEDTYEQNLTLFRNRDALFQWRSLPASLGTRVPLAEEEEESSQHCYLEKSCFPRTHGIWVILLSRMNSVLAFSPGSSSWTMKQTPWCTLSNMPGSCVLSMRAHASPCPWRSSSSSATASAATPAGPLHTSPWRLAAGRAFGTTTS